ncbi:MAG: hypothetical protein JXQ96_10580 [Cyclobacteriaceae bacterium]
MSILSSLFKKKPKKKATQCSVCKSRLEYQEGFALTTAQVVVSKKFWDHKMVEPETMSYTTAHFKNKDVNATNMRRIIFEKTAEKDHTWMTCESCIEQFTVDRGLTKKLADEWWLSENGFKIPGTGSAEKQLEGSEYEAIKEYVAMDAGKSLVRL